MANIFVVVLKFFRAKSEDRERGLNPILGAFCYEMKRQCYYHLDQGKDVLIVYIDDLEKVGEERFVDEVWKRLEEKAILFGKEPEKVSFKIADAGDVRSMKKFIKELQRRYFSKSLPKGSKSFEINGNIPGSLALNFWPDTWYIHIFMSGKWNQKVTPPLEMWTLPNVEIVYCYNCIMEKIPNYVGQMNCLKILSLESCGLKSLPTTLGLNKSLEVLKIGGNPLRGLPACVMKMNTPLTSEDRLGLFGVASMMINNLFPLKETHCCRESKETEERSTEQQTKIASPETLFDLAAHKIFKMNDNSFLSGASQRLPGDVIDNIQRSFEELKFCYYCNRGFSDTHYKTVRKEFLEFNGYKHVVFEAVTCSDFCCDAIYGEWFKLAEVEKQEEDRIQYCFDVEPNEPEGCGVACCIS